MQRNSSQNIYIGSYSWRMCMSVCVRARVRVGACGCVQPCLGKYHACVARSGICFFFMSIFFSAFKVVRG